MSIDRDVLFVFSQPISATGPRADELLTTQGTFDTTFQQTIVPATGGATISTSATLAYNTVFFIGTILFSTDPATGEALEIATGSSGLPPSDLVSLGSSAVFASYNGAGGTGLVSTDGTYSGTNFLEPVGSAFNFGPAALVRLGNVVLFAGEDTNNTYGLWSTDGTDRGSVEIAAGVFDGSTQTKVIGEVSGRVIFATGFDGAITLVSTDGTTAGTRVLGPSINAPFAAMEGASLSDGSLVLTDGSKVYVTDGLNAPKVIASYGSLSYSVPVRDLTAFGQSAAFIVYADSGENSLQASLVVTDGTVAGTNALVLPDTASLIPSSNLPGQFTTPVPLTAFGSKLFFITTEPPVFSQLTSSDLWITDGTQAGTQDILRGIDPLSVTVDGARAFIVGFDPKTSHTVVYVSDGTTQGTTAILDSGSILSTFSPGLLDPTHVFVTGTHDQYDIAPTVAGAMAIADTVPGRDGAATEGGARVITFADGIGVLDTTGNAEAVTRLYQTAFARSPDIGGLINFTEQLDAGSMTLIQAADILVASPEFFADHGLPNNGDFVTYLYQDDYGRNPDAGGLSAFTGALVAGLDRGAALLDIAQSYESRMDNLPKAGEATDATVYRLYQAVQDRAPDSGGGQFFASALANGTSVQQIAADMLGSGEYAGKFGNPSDNQFVGDLYRNLLQRTADAGGLAAFTGELAAGASRALVVAQIVGSDEARLVTSQATHDGWVYLH